MASDSISQGWATGNQQTRACCSIHPERVASPAWPKVMRNKFNERIWSPARRAAGVTNPTRQDGTHALRHHFASVLLDAGESIGALSEYLGHHDAGFTLRTYTRLMPNSAERTRRAIDGLFGGRITAVCQRRPRRQ